jgi:hypothetical protein
MAPWDGLQRTVPAAIVSPDALHREVEPVFDTTVASARPTCGHLAVDSARTTLRVPRFLLAHAGLYMANPASVRGRPRRRFEELLQAFEVLAVGAAHAGGHDRGGQTVMKGSPR